MQLFFIHCLPLRSVLCALCVRPVMITLHECVCVCFSSSSSLITVCNAHIFAIHYALCIDINVCLMLLIILELKWVLCCSYSLCHGNHVCSYSHSAFAADCFTVIQPIVKSIIRIIFLSFVRCYYKKLRCELKTFKSPKQTPKWTSQNKKKRAKI